MKEESCIGLSFFKHNKLFRLHLLFLFPRSMKGVNSLVANIYAPTTDADCGGDCLPDGEHELSGSP
jgi:hypothetical protein